MPSFILVEQIAFQLNTNVKNNSATSMGFHSAQTLVAYTVLISIMTLMHLLFYRM